MIKDTSDLQRPTVKLHSSLNLSFYLMLFLPTSREHQRGYNVTWGWKRVLKSSVGLCVVVLICWNWHLRTLEKKMTICSFKNQTSTVDSCHHGDLMLPGTPTGWSPLEMTFHVVPVNMFLTCTSSKPNTSVSLRQTRGAFSQFAFVYLHQGASAGLTNIS